MPSSKVKINVCDGEGNKIIVSFEGRITRNKILQVLDFVELLGGVSTSNEEKTLDDLSKFEKIQRIIENKFPIGWFSTQEVMVAYEDAFEEPIGLSTVSTYLSRLVEKNMLKKAGSAADRRYMLKRVSEIQKNQRVKL